MEAYFTSLGISIITIMIGLFFLGMAAGVYLCERQWVKLAEITMRSKRGKTQVFIDEPDTDTNENNKL